MATILLAPCWSTIAATCTVGLPDLERGEECAAALADQASCDLADGRPLLRTKTNCGGRSIGFAEGGCGAMSSAGTCRSRLRQPVLNHIGLSCGHGIRPKQVRKAMMTTHKPRSDLLEVWLGFLAKIEGPKRRRAQELRRRRDNPKRRATNSGSHLRAFELR